MYPVLFVFVKLKFKSRISTRVTTEPYQVGFTALIRQFRFLTTIIYFNYLTNFSVLRFWYTFKWKISGLESDQFLDESFMEIILKQRILIRMWYVYFWLILSQWNLNKNEYTRTWCARLKVLDVFFPISQPFRVEFDKRWRVGQ